MCGIAGLIGRAPADEDRVQACLKLMRRRGPDHAAHRHIMNSAGRHVHLLHSRLSIIDLDPRSHQPFERDGHWIALNGELYNYLEIRRELTDEGLEFRTDSDTEVLLAALSTKGPGILDRCEGMWAFAHWDGASESLTLCRDRFGEKPLYVHRDRDRLYFGSEIKLIATLAGHRLEVDHDQIRRYLVNGYKSIYKQKSTFFQDVEELPPGTALLVDREGRESSRRYWTPKIEQHESMSYEEAVAGARERLFRAVELRLRADVPLAFCMSGGVDSCALISIARRIHGHDVHGFTVVTDDERYDERPLVDLAVRELGIRHTEVPVDMRGSVDRLQELVRYHDAPVMTISYYLHWLLMEQVAACGYRISISGTAADELFTGYYDHHLQYLFETRDRPALNAAARSSWTEHIRPLVRNPFLGDPDAFIRNPGQRDHIYLAAERFARLLVTGYHEPFREERYTDGLLRNRMLNELFHESVPVILHEDDLNAMYFSIENRSPYLDRGLFEFCNQIPTPHLIRDGRTKAVLRDAVAGILPEPIRLCRKKVGFNAPIESLIDLDDPTIRTRLLSDGPIFEIVHREGIEALIRPGRLPNSESKFLFYFLNAKLFLEESFDSSRTDQSLAT